MMMAVFLVIKDYREESNPRRQWRLFVATRPTPGHEGPYRQSPRARPSGGRGAGFVLCPLASLGGIAGRHSVLRAPRRRSAHAPAGTNAETGRRPAKPPCRPVEFPF